ncbi:MAG: hypothetical protein KatS3mg105_0789 [Gemmatales bacterium]|nr:MAG: hypothetical protein KatS3mg105_0789 [Gemmatales bacterium]
MKVVFLVLLSAAIPVGRAWMANRRTSLFHTLNVVVAAWLAWLGAAAGPDPTNSASDVLSYVALSLTCCAGVGVLGARFPGASAWNFVLLGLLAVMLLPVAESMTLGRRILLEWPRLVLVAGILCFIALNYLPTRLGPAACLLALGGTGEVLRINQPASLFWTTGTSFWFVALSPWFAWLSLSSRRQSASQFDAVWFDFRDRYGFLWAQRVREQFNNSANHAGWPVVLHWNGLRLRSPLDPALQDDVLRNLKALLRRFLPDLAETT